MPSQSPILPFSITNIGQQPLAVRANRTLSVACCVLVTSKFQSPICSRICNYHSLVAPSLLLHCDCGCWGQGFRHLDNYDDQSSHIFFQTYQTSENTSKWGTVMWSIMLRESASLQLRFVLVYWTDP